MNRIEKRALLDGRKYLALGINNIFSQKQENETEQQIFERQKQGQNFLMEAEKILIDLIES